jgi:hypothetical protein
VLLALVVAINAVTSALLVVLYHRIYNRIDDASSGEDEMR